MNARAVALALLVSAAFACGGGGGVEPPPPPPTEPGPVNFDLEVPSGEHGGVQLTIAGGPVDSVTALSGYEVFYTASATGGRALVFGLIVGGPFIRVWVPTLSRASQYTVTVTEGAVRGTYQLVTGPSYRATRQP